jgi:8-oxo-dGTP diphosphatase
VEHWRNAKPCANAIVARGDGRVLLTRRAHAPWRDAWCAPGGFCSHDEPPEEAAVREALEETGIAIRVTGLLGIWVDAYADDPRVTDPAADWISVAYFSAIADGGVEAPQAGEVAELGWFAPNDLPRPLAPPATLEAVLRVWEDRRSTLR